MRKRDSARESGDRLSLLSRHRSEARQAWVSLLASCQRYFDRRNKRVMLSLRDTWESATPQHMEIFSKRIKLHQLHELHELVRARARRARRRPISACSLEDDRFNAG
jgi:hypothetical protein